MNNVSSLKNIKEKPTSHDVGFKKVLKDASNSIDSVLQIAVASIPPLKKIDSHLHDSMNEYFFTKKGQGLLIKEGKEFELSEDDFFIIKAGEVHSIMNTSYSENLELIYWGVKI